MDLQDKCLLVAKPNELFQDWLKTIMTTIGQAAKQPLEEVAELSLEELQADANCYIMPALPPKKAARAIEEHAEMIFRKEFSVWCQFEEIWPKPDFATLSATFNFNFYYDWMNFKSGDLQGSDSTLNSIILLIKPRPKFTEYLSTLLVQQFNLSPDEAEEKLNPDLIRNGATAVITDCDSLDDVEPFLNEHAEEIITHQLLLWGGEGSTDLWPHDTNLDTLEESFEIEIHRNTYFFPHSSFIGE